MIISACDDEIDLSGMKELGHSLYPVCKICVRATKPVERICTQKQGYFIMRYRINIGEYPVVGCTVNFDIGINGKYNGCT